MKRSISIIVAIAGTAALAGAILYDRAGRVVDSPSLHEPARIAAGERVYGVHCAACHGANLEGQPNWTSRLPNGRMPAPPHDDSGHTWHHASDVLFAVTKHGVNPPYAPTGYQSDMPAFAQTLSDDDIWNVLAFIQSRWSAQVRARPDRLQQAAEQQR